MESTFWVFTSRNFSLVMLIMLLNTQVNPSQHTGLPLHARPPLLHFQYNVVMTCPIFVILSSLSSSFADSTDCLILFFLFFRWNFKGFLPSYLAVFFFFSLEMFYKPFIGILIFVSVSDDIAKIHQVISLCYFHWSFVNHPRDSDIQFMPIFPPLMSLIGHLTIFI